MNKDRIVSSIKLVSAMLGILLIVGCFEKNRSTSQLCDNNLQLCTGLNLRDGQCRYERTDLIWQRYEVLKKSSDLGKFDELMMTKKYAKCMDLAAQIESTTLQSKKTLRTEALLHSFDSIARLEKELKNSYQPAIIYYRWTQGDKEALDQFLKLEETEYLNTPEMQLGLATYYIDKDKVHTINLLLKTLAFYNGRAGYTRDRTVPEAIKSLATSNHSLGKLDEAYFWALVGSQLNLPITNEAQLKLLYPMNDIRRNHIADVAHDVAALIEDGDFNPGLLNRLSTIRNPP
ncbi:DUF2989 domain-containing protein [Candidatus Enterovibrio escicola]|uniref:DUF2989 domain-containing protein n=3 Tax=Candidatus Enterovibrio escicola TaxID=1927127 RepID=A0A2A5T247_9GAMM|nr:DUF2989 domain-containing protein [Candidatus Enterovibrio escacola]PCS22226.1 hypothetical protein BTN49_2180 [Candidatus Enterovibrio escacola]